MRDDTLHIAFCGGSTAERLLPGLAVAIQVAARVPGLRITFVGSGNVLEYREAAAAGYEYLPLPCRPMPQRIAEVFSFLVENLAGHLGAVRFLSERRLAAVVGLGGHDSVALARAAGRRGIPLFLLDHDAIPGRATRWLARRATAVCVGLPHARAKLRCRCPVHVTGTPIARKGPSSFSPRTLSHTGLEAARNHSAPLLVVLGSSSKAINRSVPRALYKIRDRLTGWRVLHESGQGEAELTQQLYRKLGLRATVKSELVDLPSVLDASDLAISRSGGTILAELALAGLPGILLPRPHGGDNRQRHNAQVYTKAGASILLDERELPGRLDDSLAESIAGLIADARRRADMSAAMRRLARPNADANVAALILEHVQRESSAVLPVAA